MMGGIWLGVLRKAQIGKPEFVVPLEWILPKGFPCGIGPNRGCPNPRTSSEGPHSGGHADSCSRDEEYALAVQANVFGKFTQ